MRTPSLLVGASVCLLLVSACHSFLSSPSTPLSANHASKIDPPRSTALRSAPSPLEARDTAREAPQESYDTLDAATRSHFRDVQAFLDFIKRPNSNTNLGFDEWSKNFRVGNIDSLLHFITLDSLEIVDADAEPGKNSLKYSRTLLRQQLTRRKGAAFDMIGVLSLHYSSPYPQYSHTRFSSNKMDSVPNISVTFSEFELYFRSEKGSTAYKLYRLESYHISDL